MKETKIGKKIFHNRPLFYGFLSLMFAVSTAKFLFDGNLKYIILVSVVLLSIILFCALKKYFKFIILILATFMFGIGWFFVGQVSFVGRYYEGDCNIVGRISDDFQMSTYGDSVTVVLKDVYINGSKDKNISLKISLDDDKAIEIGDIIAFSGPVSQVKLFTLGNFNSFYYRDGTAYESSISNSEISLRGNSKSVDENFRLSVKNVLLKNMPNEEANVAYAVLFGDKSGVDDEIYQDYKNSGILHLLTVSGLHVGFLIAIISVILKKCRVKGILNFLISLGVLFVYAWLCGFAPSVLRAGLMGLILISAKISGKCYDGLNSLGLAGILIMLFMPLSPLDLGFQMSFFCVLSIYVIAPWISKLLKKILPKFIGDAFGISLGVQIGITPFLAIMMSNFNFVTFFINLIVIPIFSILYPFLFISVLLVALMPFLNFLLFPCAWGFSFIQIIASFFGETSLQISTQPLSNFVVVFLYLSLFMLSGFLMVDKKVKIVVCSILFTMTSLFFGLDYIQMPTNSSVAYGFYYTNSCVILTNEDGKSVMIDCVNLSYCKKFMNNLNIKNVDACFVLQDSTYNIEDSRKLGINQIVRCDNGQNFDEEILVEKDRYAIVSGFSFVYKSHNDSLLGLEISFDDTKVFIFKNKYISKQAMLSIAEKDYDFIIFGKYIDNIEYLPYKCNVLAYQENDFADISFQQNGNVVYNIKNKLWRCLD